MDVHLKPELEQLIRSKVDSGEYDSPNDVVCEALRLLEERDRLLRIQRDEISKKIDQGLESLRAGEGVDGEAVFDRIEAELDALEHTGHQ